MLKTTGLSDKPTPSRNNDNKPASSRNYGSKPVSERNNGNSEIRFSSDGVKHTKKLEKSKSQKLFKLKKSKSKKTFKSQNLAKSRKKLSKSENLSNFGAIKASPKFLIFDAKIVFNCLWLTFIKASILKYFDPKYHIWNETDVLGYDISRILS